MTNQNDESPTTVGVELSRGHVVVLFMFGNVVPEKDASTIISEK